MCELTRGALDEIMNGVEVEKPVLQILGNKKLASSGSGERYRLLVSDGVRINSFAMLATQLNHLITDNELTEYSVCQINKYAISMVNNAGKQKRVMVILSIDVKKPGSEVNGKIGNPTQQDGSNQSVSAPGAPMKPVPAAPRPAASLMQRPRLNESISSGNEIATTPIAALSPYQNRWVIKVRVTNKSAIRTWSNSRGEGKLFSMDLLDESGEIRCTAFKEQCDKFYDSIELGKVYYISRCSLKPANKQFSNLKNDYEMTFTNDTEVIPCHEESTEIPTIQFDFSPINEIDSKEKNDMIDVLGICKTCNDVQKIMTKVSKKELPKRDIELVDQSNTMVTVTLWNSQAEEFDGSNNPVVAIKGARIGEFNGGKNISLLNSSVLQIDPDIPEAHRLRGWYNQTGHSEEMRAISKSGSGGGGMNGPWLSFKESKELQLGTKENADFFIVKATISMIKSDNPLYKACPVEGCKKKVIDQDNEMYRCEKCNKDFPNFQYRLVARTSVADWTENAWATAFHDEGEILLGHSAQELGELKENDSDTFFEKFAQAAFKSFLFKMRVKMENYSDETRVNTNIVAVKPLDYKTYNDHLIAKIKELANIGKA